MSLRLKFHCLHHMHVHVTRFKLPVQEMNIVAVTFTCYRWWIQTDLETLLALRKAFGLSLSNLMLLQCYYRKTTVKEENTNQPSSSLHLWWYRVFLSVFLHVPLIYCPLLFFFGGKNGPSIFLTTQNSFCLSHCGAKWTVNIQLSIKKHPYFKVGNCFHKLFCSLNNRLTLAVK